MVAPGYDLDRAKLALRARALQLGVDRPYVRGAADTFHSFVERRNPTLLRFEHIPRLLDVGERVLRGELNRVIVLLPPRYLKSEVFSRLLPAEFLRRSPSQWVGLASYGASLAWNLSGESRTNYRSDGGVVSRESAAKREWQTDQGGGMWAAGVGGPMLGFGYHLGIVDDPTDPEKARSSNYQEGFTKWWPGKFLSRQEPGAAVVFVMQRLGTDDPVDFLFRREVGDRDVDEAPEHWHVVACEEIKDEAPLGRWDGPRGLPPTCTLEPDDRSVGMVLAPSRFSRAEVERIQRTSGTEVTAAQRQQRPAAPSGDFWKKQWFRTYDDLPSNAFNGGTDWDTAYTKNEKNAASAFVRTFRGPNRFEVVDGKRRELPGTFPIYVEDCGWDWCEHPELVEQIKALPGPHFIEAKASGKSAKQSLEREGVVVEEVTVQGDKLARASGVQPIASAGRVYVHTSAARRFLRGDRQGILRINSSALAEDKGDLDLNDAFVQALNRHAPVDSKPRLRTR